LQAISFPGTKIFYLTGTEMPGMKTQRGGNFDHALETGEYRRTPAGELF
jgi:hypothetical protein